MIAAPFAPSAGIIMSKYFRSHFRFLLDMRHL